MVRSHAGTRQGSAAVIFRPMRASRLLLAALCLPLGLGGCQRDRGGVCGLTAIAGATMLLQEFGVPGQTLGVPPGGLPPQVVARVAAGPALTGVVGRAADSSWLIGLEGDVPATIRIRFGVLILDPAGSTRGVMLYESEPIRGAPPIGQISIDTLMLPLLGIQLDPSRFEDPRCPLFPDTLRP